MAKYVNVTLKLPIGIRYDAVERAISDHHLTDCLLYCSDGTIFVDVMRPCTAQTALSVTARIYDDLAKAGIPY